MAEVVEVVEVVEIDCEKSMKLETSPKVTSPNEICIDVAVGLSVKNTCAFCITVSVKKLLHYRAGGLLQYRAFLLHYRALITLSGVFIPLSGSNYSIGRFYYIIGHLLHYRAFLFHYRALITVSVVYYIIGWYRPNGPPIHYCLLRCLATIP